MGCYNILGSVSRLPILEDDKVYCMIGLKASTRLFEYWDSHDNFLPITFPFIGHYNGYGSIIDIECNKYTNLLCDYFGYDTIEGLILKMEEDVNENGKKLDFEGLDYYKMDDGSFKIGIFYEHVWWLDMMTSFKALDANNPNRLSLTDWALTEYLSFKKIDETEKEDIYQHQDVLLSKHKLEGNIWENTVCQLLGKEPINETKHVQVMDLYSLIEKAKDLYGINIKPRPEKADWPISRCSYERSLSVIEKAVREINDIDIVTNMSLMDYFIPSSAVHERSDEEIRKEIFWFNKIRANIRFEFGLFGKDSPIVKILGGKKKYYENFLKSNIKEEKYPIYFEEAVRYVELNRILNALSWRFDIYQESSQEPNTKTLAYIKEKELEFLKQRKY